VQFYRPQKDYIKQDLAAIWRWLVDILPWFVVGVLVGAVFT
jgi:hypothetical protein